MSCFTSEKEKIWFFCFWKRVGREETWEKPAEQFGGVAKDFFFPFQGVCCAATTSTLISFNKVYYKIQTLWLIVFVVVNTGGGGRYHCVVVTEIKEFWFSVWINTGRELKKTPSNGHNLKNRKSEMGETWDRGCHAIANPLENHRCLG